MSREFVLGNLGEQIAQARFSSAKMNALPLLWRMGSAKLDYLGPIEDCNEDASYCKAAPNSLAFL